MSDVSQGPGWWQASDGKWYPPESAASSTPPAAPTGPPPAGPPTGYGPPAGGPAFGAPTGPPAYGAPGQAPYGAGVDDLKGARIGARAIDIGLMLVLGLVVGLIFGASIVATSNDDVSTATVVLVGLISNGIAIAYEVVLVSQKGATLGKMAVGLKIVKNDGSKLELADAVKRHSPTIAGRVLGIFPVIGVLGGLGVLVVLIINFVMVLSKGSSLYDQVGDTRVIRAR